ncbi:MAG: hypothetical protein ACE5G1_11190, partial [bacterium]
MFKKETNTVLYILPATLILIVAVVIFSSQGNAIPKVSFKPNRPNGGTVTGSVRFPKEYPEL